MGGPLSLVLRAIDDNTHYLEIERNVRPRQKTLILRIGYYGDRGSESEIEVTEWAPVKTLRQLDVGRDELSFDIMFSDEIKEKLYLSLPLEIFGLSARTQGCMDKAGIKTVGQLITHSPSELLKIHAFGRKSLQELKKSSPCLDLILRRKKSADKSNRAQKTAFSGRNN